MKATSSLVQVRPRDHGRYRQLPLFGHYLDEFVAWASARGYTIHTIYLQLDSVRHLEVWFRRKGRRSLHGLTTDHLAAAQRYFSTCSGDRRYAWGVQAFTTFLGEHGCLKPGRPKAMTKTQKEVSRWIEHLREDRGLGNSSLDKNQRLISQFLRFIGFERNQNAIKNVTLASVNRHLCRASARLQRKAMQHVVASVRGFLRFQFMHGIIQRPLHLQIDTVRVHRSEQLPHPVQWSELQQLLRCIDRSTALGRRDYAVLLLAATYGLRASDVANLTMDAIDWRGRTIQIVQCKTRQPLTLPLTDEVGIALADYLRRARPTSPCRQIFLRRMAPIAPLSLPGMSNTLRHASRAAGVRLEATGFRCLRHALALRLLRQGSSLKGIGDILGHRSPASTSEYLRLNVEDLRQVALPVPIGTKNLAPSMSNWSMPEPRRHEGARSAPRGWGWRSFLGKAMCDYLKLQRALGRDYYSHEHAFHGLDFFLAKHYPRACRLTPAIFTAWASGLVRLSPTTARMRMMWVRKFCCHVARSRPTIFIPDLRTFPKELPHQAPFLFSAAEVARVLAATTSLNPTLTNPLRPRTFRMALLMLFCCGLRQGEVLKLRLADIDTQEMVLRINESKFNKSRLVPLSPSLARELRRYLKDRRRMKISIAPTSPLVYSAYLDPTDPMTPMPFWQMWRQVCCRAHVFNHRGRPPRLHDLRHSFAVAALQRGYRNGQDPQAVLPRLARYMGHANAKFTHYYLKFTEPLRCAANDRFRHHLAGAILSPANHEQRGIQ